MGAQATHQVRAVAKELELETCLELDHCTPACRTPPRTARVALYPETTVWDYEIRPRWLKGSQWVGWRRMFPCRCTHGPAACRGYAIPYYGYLCRACNLRLPGVPTPLYPGVLGCAMRGSGSLLRSAELRGPRLLGSPLG